MNYELAQLVISLFGFIFVGLSVVYLAMQTKAVTEQTSLVADSVRSTVYGTVATQIVDANRVFIEYPDLRKYFYDRAPLEESGEDRERVEAVAEYLLDYFDSVLMQMKYLPQVWPRGWWDNYIVDSFSQSEVLCDYLDERRTWYRPELAKKMKLGREHRVTPSEEKVTS